MTSDDEQKTARQGADALPAVVRGRLLEFTENLEAALGESLVGVLVHGSVVRSEYRPGESNVDVVVILESADFAHLEAIGNATQLARYSARIEATILVESEIAGASDAFPLLYDEIKHHNVLLAGRDPFVAVEVHDTHRRLRIEQELREAQIRLRRAVTDAFGAPEAIAGAVARKVKQVRTPLHALLALKGIPCAPDLAAVLTKAGEIYGVDVTPLHAPSESSPDVETSAAHAALVALLTKSIEDVNDALPGE
jgi:predicted nucleotidyltransferase